MLAEIMKMKGNYEKASELYKQGLVMESGQIVKAIDMTQLDPAVSSEDTADLVPEPVSGSDKTVIS
jgi:hypothetical protein